MNANTLWFIPFVIISTFNISCNFGNFKDKANGADSISLGNSVAKVSYQLFRNIDSTFGYNILLGSRIYIHQPIIPHLTGWKGFKEPESASALAGFLVSRIKDNHPHLMLPKAFVDSVLNFSGSDTSFDIDQRKRSSENADLLSERIPKEEEGLSNFPLSMLADAPIKATWRSLGKAPFGKRNITSSFSIGNRVYIGAGALNDENTNDLWAYDARKGYWTCYASFPKTGRISGIGFVINGKGYIGLGALKSMAAFGFENDFYEYDPDLNIWTEKEHFPGKGRIDAAFFVVNGKGYAGLGYSGYPLQDFYEFDPVSNHWKRIHDFLGGGVSSAAGLGVSGKGFIVCGGGVNGETKSVFEYQPDKDLWIQREDFPGKARYYLNGNGIDSNLFMAGAGRAEGGAVNYRDYYFYNTQTGKWTGVENYFNGPGGISRTANGIINGNVYSGSVTNDFYQDEWNVFEYYFSTRKDTGLYNESVCYPMKYDGTWELYQECTGNNCFAGVAIKTKEKLGEFCYSSMIGIDVFNEIKSQQKNIILIPRAFRISTGKKPVKPYSVRLFFPRESYERIAKWKSGNGIAIDSPKLIILVYDRENASLESISDKNQIAFSQVITPALYGYSFNQETWVAEFQISSRDIIARIAVAED